MCQATRYFPLVSTFFVSDVLFMSHVPLHSIFTIHIIHMAVGAVGHGIRIYQDTVVDLSYLVGRSSYMVDQGLQVLTRYHFTNRCK